MGNKNRCNHHVLDENKECSAFWCFHCTPVPESEGREHLIGIYNGKDKASSLIYGKEPRRGRIT